MDQPCFHFFLREHGPSLRKLCSRRRWPSSPRRPLRGASTEMGRKSLTSPAQSSKQWPPRPPTRLLRVRISSPSSTANTPGPSPRRRGTRVLTRAGAYVWAHVVCVAEPASPGPRRPSAAVPVRLPQRLQRRRVGDGRRRPWRRMLETEARQKVHRRPVWRRPRPLLLFQTIGWK